MATLHVVRGPNAGTAFKLHRDTTIIGRDESCCDIVLDHTAVSRRQTSITLVDGKYLVEDLVSRNGTILNGTVLRPGPDGQQPLADGDQLELSVFFLAFDKEDRTGEHRVVVTSGDREPDVEVASEVDVGADGSSFRKNEQSAAKLRTALAIIEEMSGIIELKDVFSKILESLLHNFPNAGHGFILMRDAADEPFTTVATNEGNGDGQTRHISSTIVNLVADTQKAILSKDAMMDERFQSSSSVRGLKLRSIMCAPLIGKNRQTMGLMQLEVSGISKPFTQDDLDIFAAVARNLSVAVENARMHDAATREHRIQEQRLRTLIDYAPEAIVVLDADTGLFVDANENALQLYGVPRDELYKMGPVNTSPPELDGRPTADVAREKVGAALAGEVPVFEWLHQNAEGQLISCEVRLVRMPSASGNLIRGSITDITDRKHAERVLRENEQRLRLIVEQLPAIIWTTDEELNFTSSQGAALQGLHLETNEVVGQSLYEFFQIEGTKHPRIAPHLSALMGNSAVLTEEWAGRAFEARVEPLRDQDGRIRGTVGIAHDVTERIEAAHKLQVANDRLEERVEQRTAQLAASNADLEQFAYIVSHDLLEPLRSIHGFCGLLKKRYEGRLDEKADEYINFAMDAAKHMQTLIRELLHYSRVATRAKKHEPVDCNEVCDAAISNLKAAIEESQAVVERGDLPSVMGDRTRLIQLFQNLIANATRFHGERNPVVHIRVVDAGDQWRIEVQDNGIGVHPDHADRIFMIFQRLHHRESFPGVGIGLAICKKVVEAHRGTIGVESSPGEGATFFFTLRKSEIAQP